MQYRKSLIGKHFKTLMQTMPFHIHNVANDAQFALVKAVGELGAVLWVHKIKNMDEYLADLQILISNVLDAFDAIDPSKIVTKIKLHLLPHLIEDIRRFGPAIRNSTEIYECYNAIFRLCSVLSNHQAPSRDIAYKFSSIKRVKHVLSGGYWLEDGIPTQASLYVRAVLQKQRVVQRHLGWVPSDPIEGGSVRAVSKAKTVILTWEDTLASRATDTTLIIKTRGLEVGERAGWKKGVAVTSQSSDVCACGSWVFVQCDRPDSPPIIGRISEILVHAKAASLSTDGLVTLDLFYLGEERHPEFNLPILTRISSFDKAQHSRTISSGDILFRFSAQHDCRLNGCQATAHRAQRQEHEDTDRTESLIQHTDDDNYLVNLYGLHNASILRDVLPRHLVKPSLLFPEQKERHDERAAALRLRNSAKRAQNKEKRKAKTKNQVKQNEAEAEVLPLSDSEAEAESEDTEQEEVDVIDEGTVHRSSRKRRKII